MWVLSLVTLKRWLDGVLRAQGSPPEPPGAPGANCLGCPLWDGKRRRDRAHLCPPPPGKRCAVGRVAQTRPGGAAHGHLPPEGAVHSCVAEEMQSLGPRPLPNAHPMWASQRAVSQGHSPFVSRGVSRAFPGGHRRAWACVPGEQFFRAPGPGGAEVGPHFPKLLHLGTKQGAPGGKGPRGSSVDSCEGEAHTYCVTGPKFLSRSVPQAPRLPSEGTTGPADACLLTGSCDPQHGSLGTAGLAAVRSAPHTPLPLPCALQDLRPGNEATQSSPLL